MDDRDDQPGVRFSAGEPPPGDAPAPATAAPTTARRNISTRTTVGIAAIVLVAGFGIGYATFHRDASKQSLQAWYSGGGRAAMDQFTKDVGNLTTAASTQDPATVHLACAALQATVESAQAYGPIPDAQAQASWAAALAAYERGATDCIAGTDRLDATLINQFSDELGTGESDLEQVATRISQIKGN